jgi:Zn-dependent M28 family amino/carboxypeptidase
MRRPSGLLLGLLLGLLMGCRKGSEPMPPPVVTPIAAPPAATPAAPAPRPARPRAPSSSLLKRHVASLTAGVRVAGEASEREAAQTILEQLKAMGYSAELQGFRMPGGTRSQNVIAIKRADRRPLLIIGAHYDSKAPDSPGAIDNASGVAALLEVARCLQGEDLSVKVAFVAFGAEERLHKGAAHHVGSRHCARQILRRVPKKEIIGMIDIDMACGEKLYVGSMRLADQSLVQLAQREAKSMGLTFIDEKERGNSDHEAFERRGIPVAYIHYWPAKEGAYHNARDTEDKVDYDQVRVVTELVLRTVRALDKLQK